MLFWTAEQVADIKQGVKHFLQWDYSISAVALLTWCMEFYYHHAIRYKTLVGRICCLLWIPAMEVVFGPCSASIFLYTKLKAVPSRRRRSCIGRLKDADLGDAAFWPNHKSLSGSVRRPFHCIKYYS
jgi:hypothetical protein